MKIPFLFGGHIFGMLRKWKPRQWWLKECLCLANFEIFWCCLCSTMITVLTDHMGPNAMPTSYRLQMTLDHARYPFIVLRWFDMGNSIISLCTYKLSCCKRKAMGCFVRSGSVSYLWRSKFSNIGKKCTICMLSFLSLAENLPRHRSKSGQESSYQ